MRSLVLATALSALLLVGCNSEERDYGGVVQPNQEVNYDAQIKEIEANTHMPQGAKDAALSDLRSRKAESERRKASGG